MQPRECGEWQLECRVIRERGARLLASEQWADCSFLLGREQTPVKAHRLILAMASPVFESMFYGPLAEGDAHYQKGPTCDAPIPVPDIQPDAFRKLLQYVYTDDVDLENYEIASVLEVYDAAEKYMLPHLQTLCMGPQHACGIFELANFCEDKKLEDLSLKAIKDKTKLALAPGSSFEDLALGTVIHIFSLDELTIDSELDLLVAAERYVSAWQKRVKEIADLKSSSPDVDPEDVSVSNSIGKDTNNEVDTVKCHHNGNGDIETHDENISIPKGATVENQESMTSDTQCSEVINKSRSEGTFRFTVNNVSKMKSVISPSFYVRDLPWKIVVRKIYENGRKCLSFFVRCNGESKSITWSCNALIDYTLISHKPDTKPSFTQPTRKYDLFCSSSDSVGFPDFMRWNDVMDPKKGFVKDNSITLEVHVTAKPSQGLSWSPKNCMSGIGYDGIDIEDESVQALLRPIRFLTVTIHEWTKLKYLKIYEPKLKLVTSQDFMDIWTNRFWKRCSRISLRPLPRFCSTSTIPRSQASASSNPSATQ